MWQKNHNVPSGFYIAKLVSAKVNNATSYRLELEILKYTNQDPYPEPQVIVGYCERQDADHSFLAGCFSDGEVHSRVNQYSGGLGVISLTDSGWVELVHRKSLDFLFPGIKETL